MPEAVRVAWSPPAFSHPPGHPDPHASVGGHARPTEDRDAERWGTPGLHLFRLTAFKRERGRPLTGHRGAER